MHWNVPQSAAMAWLTHQAHQAPSVVMPGPLNKLQAGHFSFHIATNTQHTIHIKKLCCFWWWNWWWPDRYCNPRSLLWLKEQGASGEGREEEGVKVAMGRKNLDRRALFSHFGWRGL